MRSWLCLDTHLPERIINDVMEAINEAGLYIDAEQVEIELPDPKDRVFYEVLKMWFLH